MKRILTGLKPTGKGLHLGNYFGAFKPFLEQQEGKESFVMIADLHSLTSVHEGETLKQNRENFLLEYFSLIPDELDICVFEQSKILVEPYITWIISSVTPYSLMLRAHSFKDSKNKNSDINMAIFNYPILMTTDIISYDIDLVPVGKDQKQHMEFARDIAGNFNKTYKNDFFKLPEPIINEDGEMTPGTDGRKMSKSYDNFLGIFDNPKILKKKIMSIVTDDKGLEEPKDPDKCNVFALIKLLAPIEKQNEIRKKYLAGNYGYGHAKLELLDIFLEYFKTQRDKYETLKNNKELLYKKIQKGNSKANQIANKKYEELLKIVGLD